MAVSEKTTLRRNKWKRRILDIIRRTPNASRIVVKRLSGLSMDSTLGLIDELLQDGLIISLGKSDDGKVGRKATLLKINPDGCYFIGVRFSAAGVTGVCMDFDRQVICTGGGELPRSPDAQDMIEAIAGCISDLIGHLGERRQRLRGIGIGAPGIIDLKRGVIARYVHIPDWENVPLRDTIGKRFGIPTYLEHGVKCTARALLSMTDYADVRDMLFMQMDRGINMAVVVDGRIVSGASYLSGEVGHMHVEDNGVVCECGRAGCLETIATTGALYRNVEKGLSETPERFSVLAALLHAGERVRVETLCRAADMGCEGSVELLAHAGRAVGTVLASSITLLNPQKIILSGRLTASEPFRAAVENVLKERCFSESLAVVTLNYRQPDPLLDTLGAAEVPFNKQFDEYGGG